MIEIPMATNKSMSWGEDQLENLVKFYPILWFKSPYFFSEFYNHPNYRDDGSNDFDYAIIKLASPVTFSDRVSPICLPSASTNYDNKVATVTGWGYLFDSFNSVPTNSDILQKVRMNLIDCRLNSGCLLFTLICRRNWGFADMYMYRVIGWKGPKVIAYCS